MYLCQQSQAKETLCLLPDHFTPGQTQMEYLLPLNKQNQFPHSYHYHHCLHKLILKDQF